MLIIFIGLYNEYYKSMSVANNVYLCKKFTKKYRSQFAKYLYKKLRAAKFYQKNRLILSNEHRTMLIDYIRLEIY